jgi:hypothetical protein
MCFEECRSEAGQRKEVAVPRRSPPRIVPGMSDVELFVGGPQEGVDSVGARQVVDFPCSRSCSRGPGE